MLGPNRIRKDTMIKYQEARHPRSRGWKQEGDVAAVFVFVFVIKYKAGEAGRGCSGSGTKREERKFPLGWSGPALLASLYYYYVLLQYTGVRWAVCGM